ncbi:DUF302 domain-containing protein [Candidatus Thiosymbion oneisti]|uniref:DUF302 domain-containing protein n=1 Tax=Candidatus Thiosymbion oneisti TaxID=589554 RepID=UPI000A665F7C|nr:DUF302 domain-containing protein [Candidatus Thiosymbion oneisti]
MKLIRNLLALIGLLAVLAVAAVAVRLGPTLAKFDDRFLAVYQEFAGKLLKTGDPGVSMMWSVPVAADLSAEEVVESMKSIAVSRNLLFVGESPFYKQVRAITGEDYRYVNFLSFCDAQVGKKMLEYRDHYSGFMPCRIALVEDKNGRLWMYTMNLDLMIHGGKELPEDLKTDAIRVRENIMAIMEGAAKGEF